MSSGNLVYSAEEKGILLDQFGSVMELVKERKRPARAVSAALQAVIADDDVVVVQKVTVTPTGKVFHVNGDARSAAEAIQQTDCPVKWDLAKTPAKIPMILQPVDCKARLAPLGKTLTTEEVYKISKIASPAQLFAFAAKFKDEQLDEPIVTVWLDAEGQFWYAVLYRSGSGRRVGVFQDHPDYEWDGYCRVLLCE